MGDEMGGFLHIGIKEGVIREFRSQYFLFGIDGFQHDEKDTTDKQPLGYTETDAKQSVEKVGNHQLDDFVHQHADEVKVVFRPAQGEADALLRETQVERWALIPAENHSLQPCADPATGESNIAETVAYILAHPHWRLSLQTHKLLNIR